MSARRLVATSALSGFCLVAWIGAAQPQADPRPLPPGDPRGVPEKAEPAPSGSAAPGAGEGTQGAGETLSERLDRTEGVLKPPPGIDPEIRVPAPVPNPGTTIVIPPPGATERPEQRNPD